MDSGKVKENMLTPEQVKYLRWGLQRCRVDKNCGVCNAVGEDDEFLLQIRDLYVEGVDFWIIEKVFDIPKEEIRKHGFNRKWTQKRRRFNRNSLKAGILALIGKRLEENWSTTTEQTPDKMIELLAKAAEIGVARGPLVNINQQNNTSNGTTMTWEERVYRRQKQELPEPQETLEGIILSEEEEKVTVGGEDGNTE